MGEHKQTIENYKNKFKKEAESLVQDEFPEKFIELNNLITDKRFSLGRLNELEEDLNIPVPDPVLLHNDVDGLDEPNNKKRKVNCDLLGSKVLLLPNGACSTNSKICELIDIVKPKIIQLMDHANVVKMWITYLVPRIEDGNNFGVSIQEDALAEARQVEVEGAQYLDQMSRYFMTRGKIIAQIAKYPHVVDLRRTVKELDEKQFVSLRLMVCELRNSYAMLHDLITKNLEKIKKPRNSNLECMY